MPWKKRTTKSLHGHVAPLRVSLSLLPVDDGDVQTKNLNCRRRRRRLHGPYCYPQWQVVLTRDVSKTLNHHQDR